jgi:D-serine deaminase-like pyridoxal phosphate-dependent protein
VSAQGRHVTELETPAAVVDLDRLERNLARAATYAAQHALALHPHVKTHKTLEIAERQLAAGASGLTVAKTSEADVLVGAGLRAPLLLHYPVVGPEKVARLVALAEHGPLTVALDSLAAAEPIAAALARRGLSVDALIELDVGMRRTGVTPEGALALAEGIEALGGGLRVAGLSCYPGHLRGLDEDALAAGLGDVDAVLAAAQALLVCAGIRCERISAGSTATLLASHRTRATELRPGNYALLDRAEARGAFSDDDCALRVHTTVVSTSVPGRLVLDAGSKALSEAGPPPGSVGFGAVVGRDDIVVDRLSEEHAHAVLAPGAIPPRVGDRVEVTPNHACTCVNLHEVLYGARDGSVEVVMPVAARGAIR